MNKRISEIFKQICKHNRTDMLSELCEVFDSNSFCNETSCAGCPFVDTVNLAMAINQEQIEPGVQQQAFYEDSKYKKNGEERELPDQGDEHF